jgi:cytochrome P450
VDQTLVPSPSDVAAAVAASLDVAHRHDPYPAYSVLRDAPGFPPGPLGTHVLSRYADCEVVLADPAWSHAEESRLLHPDSDVHLPGSFLWMDPPDHTRLRGLAAVAFSRSRITALRPRVQAIVDGLLDDLRDRGDTVVDLVAGFAFPLPFTVISELLGVPEPDRSELGAWFTTLLAPALAPEPPPDAVAASARVVGYLTAMLDRR